jgi:hypothetical protein
MRYEDRLNQDEYLVLYNVIANITNPAFADYVLTHSTQAELKDLKAQMRTERADFEERIHNLESNSFKYAEYKKRKPIAEAIKKDKYTKNDTIKVIKAFIDGNKATRNNKIQHIAPNSGVTFEQVDVKDALLPYYGNIQSSVDIRKIGDELKSQDKNVGLSVFGITPKQRHDRAYVALSDLINPHGEATFIETTPDDIDEYSDKTQLEDLDPYSEGGLSNKEDLSAMPPLGYDYRQVVTRDLVRDNPEEFHVSKGHIKEAIPGLRDTGLGKKADKIMDWLEENYGLPLVDYEKPSLIKRMRKELGLSPYVIDFILHGNSKLKNMGANFQIPDLLPIIKHALKQDLARPTVDRMLKHPEQYGSDRRIKRITSALGHVVI